MLKFLLSFTYIHRGQNNIAQRYDRIYFTVSVSSGYDPTFYITVSILQHISTVSAQLLFSGHPTRRFWIGT